MADVTSRHFVLRRYEDGACGERSGGHIKQHSRMPDKLTKEYGGLGRAECCATTPAATKIAGVTPLETLPRQQCGINPTDGSPQCMNVSTDDGQLKCEDDAKSRCCFNSRWGLIIRIRKTNSGDWRSILVRFGRYGSFWKAENEIYLMAILVLGFGI